MSKERLEEIKEKYSKANVIEHLNGIDIIAVAKEDIVWLIQQSKRVQKLETTVDFYQSALRDADRRVQELEEEVFELKVRLEGAHKYNDAMKVIADDYEKQNKRYREALEEIRNYGTYELNNVLKTGYAWIAHEALEEDNEPLRAEVSE